MDCTLESDRTAKADSSDGIAPRELVAAAGLGTEMIDCGRGYFSGTRMSGTGEARGSK
ncbi:hypothetical protein BRAS3843_1870023 [Bradyrhizobium sp. STM 3843]|nr:hypothetical protein BRAS3843_1870023 [Bradyrhizobium sp. STM 3843]